MSDSKQAPELNERAQQILKALVQQYIHDGQPVGSKSLVQSAGLSVSPATIRNVMADLEDKGFLISPHTSAGRVPTIAGYRFFVDSLVSVKRLDKRKVDAFREELQQQPDTQGLVATASQYVSGLTHLAGIVTLPLHKTRALRQIEFLPLSERRVLAILVTEDQEVQNRIVELHRPYSESELRKIANALTSLVAGKDIHQARDHLIAEMQATRADMNQLMLDAVNMAQKVFSDQDNKDFVLAGEVNLMNFEELSNINQLRKLFEAFNKKQEILHLLDKCLNSDGVQIFIGDESGYQVLGECSVVTAPYSVDGKVLGVLGVIGPTRIPYDKVIPIVDITARVLGNALNSK